MDKTTATVIHPLERMMQDALQQGRRVLRFAPELEEQFIRQRQGKQRARYVAVGLLAVVMYVLFIPMDRLFVPDIQPFAFQMRLGVALAMLCGVVAVRFCPSANGQDLLAVLLMLLGAGSLMALLLLSRHPNAAHYYNGLLLVNLLSNILLRLPFCRALAGSVLVFGAFVWTVFHAPAMPLLVAYNACSVMLCSTALGLVANYLLEIEGRRIFLQGLVRDYYVLKLEDSQRDLEALLRIDPLTGVANRRGFDEGLGRLAREARRSGLPLSLLMVDVDCFKAYNDAYGHLAGDRCLQRIAAALGQSLYRPQDFLARYGGEEFAILLPETSAEAAMRIAERVRAMVEAMALEHHASPVAEHVTLSIGLASAVPADGAEQQLVSAADQALYAAKEAGRNQVRVSALAV